jgi:hypothetical protein
MDSGIECLYCIDIKKYEHINSYVEINPAIMFLHVTVNSEFSIRLSFRHHVAICRSCYDSFIKEHLFIKSIFISKEEYLASTIIDG